MNEDGDWGLDLKKLRKRRSYGYDNEERYVFVFLEF